jgi:hypothetical protein
MADNRKMDSDRAGNADGRSPRVRKAVDADARKPAPRQSTPEVEADDTLEGEGSPGLTITGGGGHA